MEDRGKKPIKQNLSVGKPDETKDDIAAQGPGIETISKSLFIRSRTNLYPGSEIKGVPLSETKARFKPLSKYSTIFEKIRS